MVESEDRMADLELDWDEAEHLLGVPEDVEDRLALTKAAAVLTLNGVQAADEELTLNEPRGLVSLLLAKVAQDLRFASIGITLGHYSGAFPVLRSALESLSYASLFDSDPREVGRWLKSALSSGPRDHEFDAELLRDARRALIDLEDEPRIIAQGVSDLVAHANKHIHTTAQGLAHQFGIDFEDLLPDELAQLLGTEGIDVEYALSLFLMSKRFETRGLPDGETVRVSGESIPIWFSIRYDHDTLNDLSLFAFYISHRCLDLTKSALDISDVEFNRNYNQWHRELAKS